MRRLPATRRSSLAVLAAVGLALAVAADVKRAPPDFWEMPVRAVVRDGAGHALWSIRVAPAAHEIAADAVAAPPPAGDVYQLWLATETGARSLGVLPVRGRKIIAEMPELAARLAGDGELLISREAAPGSRRSGPGGPVLFRARLGDAN